MEQNNARTRDLLLWQPCKFVTVIVAAAILGDCGQQARAASDNVSSMQTGAGESNEALLKRFEAMDRRMKSLEAQIKQQKTTASASNPPASAETTDPTKSRSKTAKTGDPSAGSTLAAPDQPAPKPGKSTASTNPDMAVKQVGDKPILGILDSPAAGLAIGAYGEVFFGADAKSCRRRPVAEFVRRPPRRPAADLRHYRQHHLQRRDRVRAFRRRVRQRRQAAWHRRDRAGLGRFQVQRPSSTGALQASIWCRSAISISITSRPSFTASFRPELYNGLIPSTWKVPATSLYGTIADGIKYQVMLSASERGFWRFIRSS